MKFMVQKILVVVSLVSLSACSGGGKVEVSGGAGPAQESQPAAVKVKPYKTLNADQAVDLIKNAATGEEQDAAIERIKRESDADFDWAQFWTGLTHFRKAPEKILALSDISCRDSHFVAFASFVASLKMGYEYVTGTQRTCGVGLGAALSEKFMAVLWARFDTATSTAQAKAAAKEFARFVIDEQSRKGGDDWIHALGLLSDAQWTRLARTLSDANASTELVSLIETHRAVFGSAKFTDQISAMAIHDASILKDSIDRLGLTTVLRVLERAPRRQYEEREGNELARLLFDLAARYNPSTLAGELESRWEEGLKQLALLRAVEARMDDRVRAQDALKWLEDVQRSMERSLRISPTRGAEFVARAARSSLDALWLRMRLMGGNIEDRARLFADALPTESPDANRLDRVLYARVKAHIASRGAEQKKAIAEFCDVLKAEGITGVTNLEQAFTARGCHVIHGAPRVEISRAMTIMPFDSVLSIPGSDLAIRGSNFDGSIIDLSATQKHAPLAAEATPADHDAIAFPVLVGFKISSETRIPGGKGMHYFIMHLPYHDAHKGPVSKQLPLAGYRGGNLTLNMDDSTNSFAPAFVSEGGEGQAGAQRLAGGKSSTSSIDPDLVEDWLNRLEETLHLSAQGEFPILHRNPSVQFVKQLKKAAERDHNRIKLFIQSGYAVPTDEEEPLLEAEQRTKISQVCGGLTNLTACFEGDLNSRVTAHLEDILSTHQTIEEELEIVPTLNSSTYTSPAGEQGDSNPSGAKGADGDISPKGF